MITFLFYLCKASITLAVLYLVFWLFLKKDTFHQFKRVILLTNLFLSLVLPLITIPGWEIKAKGATSVYSTSIDPAYYQMLLQQLHKSTLSSEQSTSVMQWIFYTYWIVTLVLLLKLIGELFSVYTIISKADISKKDSYTLAVHKKVISPFSFFSYLVVNPEQYEDAVLSQILAHEQAHVSQKHTFDVLLTEIYTAFFWFNPFAWLHKSLIRLNLEYIADKSVVERGISTADYQLNLLQLTVEGNYYHIANNFNQSSILKRIHMMNKAHSPARLQVKYVFVVPFLTGLVFLFNATQAEEVESKIKYLSTPDTSQAERQAASGSSAKVIRTITGIVKDADTDKPVAGAYVQVKGGKKGVFCDSQGKFSIQVSEDDKILSFQYPNYTITEMAITSQPEIIVLLKVFESQGAKSQIANVRGSTLITTRFGEHEHFSGKITISDPFAPPSDSISYWVDGKKVDKADIENISPDKIESVNVYKDATSLRKYKEQGKKGVVEIILKK